MTATDYARFTDYERLEMERTTAAQFAEFGHAWSELVAALRRAHPVLLPILVGLLVACALLLLGPSR